MKIYTYIYIYIQNVEKRILFTRGLTKRPDQCSRIRDRRSVSTTGRRFQTPTANPDPISTHQKLSFESNFKPNNINNI